MIKKVIIKKIKVSNEKNVETKNIDKLIEKYKKNKI